MCMGGKKWGMWESPCTEILLFEGKYGHLEETWLVLEIWLACQEINIFFLALCIRTCHFNECSCSVTVTVLLGPALCTEVIGEYFHSLGSQKDTTLLHFLEAQTSSFTLGLSLLYTNWLSKSQKAVESNINTWNITSHPLGSHPIRIEVVGQSPFYLYKNMGPIVCWFILNVCVVI